jgi:RecB family exonuclease
VLSWYRNHCRASAAAEYLREERRSMSTYHRYIETLLSRHAAEGERCFVFPSEVTAEWMQRTALRAGGLQAVRRDRFISWDRFKEDLFSPRRSSRPVNGVYRSLFTARLLREHTEQGPLFRSLIGGESPGRESFDGGSPGRELSGGGTAGAAEGGSAAETGTAGGASRFRGYLNRILPTLKQLNAALQEAGEEFPAELAADFRMLYERYNAFLREHDLYEPSFEQPRSGEEVELRYELFYPELLEDYREYAGLLEANPRVTVHSMAAAEGEPADPGVTLLRYDNAAEELEALLDEVEKELEAGASPLELAITLPDFDGWRSRLEEKAAVRQIPLSFRSGRPLAELAAGRFFRRIQELHRSGYAHQQMKELFLDPAYPWREREQLRELIDFGIRYQCVRGYEGRGERYDPWQVKLSSPVGEGMEQELRLLNRLRTYVRSLIGSSSAGQLLSRVTPFLRLFLDPEGWSEEEERALQFALLVLGDLAEAEEHCGLSVPRPFALWLSLLEEQNYVHAERSTAVPVYRYRVSAGIAPRAHFIAGAGQQETRCRHIPFPFLREDRRNRLSGEERDASAAFLRAYALSGDRVRISCADRGFTAPQLPPAEFYPQRRIAAAVRDPREVNDRVAAEQRYWAKQESGVPGSLYRVQQLGFARMAAAGFAEKGADYTAERIEDDELREVLRGKLRRDEEDEVLWFSPTRLEQLKGCPFMYFIEEGLEVADEDREPQFADPRRLGILYHRIFSELLQRITEEEGAFGSDEEAPERYGRWAEEIVERLFAAEEAGGRGFLPPVWRRERDRARDKMRRYLRREAEAFAGYRLEESEVEYRREIDAGGVGFSGRIDRHSVFGEDSAVVDYKSGKMPKPKETAVKGEEPPVIQLPVYVYLLEQSGRDVTSASYYGVKENAFRHVYTEHKGHGRSQMSREYLDQVIGSVCETARQAAQAILAGDLQVPEECEACDYRGLCRSHFRIGGEHA